MPTSDSREASGDRFASLDQWRGWAMVLVLINHALKSSGWVEGLGRTGVNLFFVISGLLTAMSLLSIQRKRQSIWLQLPARRLWRLWPTLGGFVLVVFFLRPLLWPDESLDALPALLFFANYAPHSPPFSHLWSISCEMQFYLVSPLLFWLGTRTGPAGNWLLSILTALLLTCGGLYVLIHSGKIEPPLLELSFYGKYTAQVAVWPMVLGFLWQLYRPEKMPPLRSVRKFLPATVVCLNVAVFAALAMQNRLATVLVGIALMPVVIACYETRTSLPGKAGKALVWLGKRTYSIYLMQQLFTIAAPYDPVWWPIGGLISIAAGGIFYALIESRFVKSPSR